MKPKSSPHPSWSSTTKPQHVSVSRRQHLIQQQAERSSARYINLAVETTASLPYELRTKIYKLALCSTTPLPLLVEPSQSKCKGIRLITDQEVVGWSDAEFCRKLYYSQNVFECEEKELTYSKIEPMGHKTLIHSLKLHLSDERSPRESTELTMRIRAYSGLAHLDLRPERPLEPNRSGFVSPRDLWSDFVSLRDLSSGFVSLRDLLTPHGLSTPPSWPYDRYAGYKAPSVEVEYMRRELEVMMLLKNDGIIEDVDG